MTRMPRGEDHPGSILTDALVMELRRRVAAGESISAALWDLRLGIEYETGRAAIRGETWTHLPGAVPSTRTRRARDERDDALRAAYDGGATVAEIALAFGCTRETVRRVVHRQRPDRRRQLAQRLERSDPVSFAAYLAGEQTLRAACIEAGIRKPAPMLGKLRRIWLRATPEERAAFLAEVDPDVSAAMVNGKEDRP